MEVDRKDDDVNNCSMWTYVPDPETGRLQLVSNNVPSRLRLSAHLVNFE